MVFAVWTLRCLITGLTTGCNLPHEAVLVWLPHSSPLMPILRRKKKKKIVYLNSQTLCLSYLKLSHRYKNTGRRELAQTIKHCFSLGICLRTNHHNEVSSFLSYDGQNFASFHLWSSVPKLSTMVLFHFTAVVSEVKGAGEDYIAYNLSPYFCARRSVFP